MKNKNKDREKFVSRAMLTDGMLEDPNQFYKDIAALAGVIDGDEDED